MNTEPAMRAFSEGRLKRPPRQCTVRPARDYEMRLPMAEACNAAGGAGPQGEQILCERPSGHAGAHARNVTVTWESCPVCKNKPYQGFQCTRCGRSAEFS